MGELRRLLEPNAARQAAGRATAAQVKAILATAGKLGELAATLPASADPVADYLDTVYQQECLFHSTIWQAAGNRLVTSTLENLHILAVAAMKAHERADLFRHAATGSAAEHLEIAEAIAAGDGEAAYRAMHHHLRPNPWEPPAAVADPTIGSKRKNASS
jgi:DNA-binding FadR family transcriptional regulator